MNSAHSTILATTLLSFAACSNVPLRPDVAAAVAHVDVARLREHVDALDAIGPRPVGDAEATNAVLAYVGGRLRALGYEVREETFEFALQSTLSALVRPASEPEAEPTVFPLPVDVAWGGPHAWKEMSSDLKEDGWVVESMMLGPAGEEQMFSVTNLIATRPGLSGRDEVLELGAHYDTVPYSPGAVDNSSGVAAVLEVARVVSTVPARRSLRFCFFGAEEVGFRGSAAHVRELTQVAGPRVAGLLNLDSVGFTARGPGSQKEPEDAPWFLSIPDEGDFVAVVGNPTSGWLGNLVEGCMKTYSPDLRYYSANRLGSLMADADRSDHSQYWRAGLSAICLSDTGDFRSAYYHSPGDTPDRVDYAFLAAITRATAAAALHWAQPIEVPMPARTSADATMR